MMGIHERVEKALEMIIRQADEEGFEYDNIMYSCCYEYCSRTSINWGSRRILLRELTDDQGEVRTGTASLGEYVRDTKDSTSCGNVFEMGILHFYQKEKKGIGGLMGISLAMIQRSPTYTPLKQET